MKTINFKQLNFQAGDYVLDLGCGEGRHVIAAYAEADVCAVGVDLGFNDVKVTREKFQPFAEDNKDKKQLYVSCADALRLPFPDAIFDKVICSEVLEHIPDYQSTLREIARVLKPGGVAAISVPSFAPEWLCWRLSDDYHSNEGGHIRIFKSHELKRAVENSGLFFIRQHKAHALHSIYWWLQCLFWKTKENNPLVKAWHQLLLWDLMEKPKATRAADALLNPLIGKSLVMYFHKGSKAMQPQRYVFAEEQL